MKKKLLLLGGSAQQVVAIERAKSLGYQTILCDYLPDNPGQLSADSFYLVSTTDKEAVLDVAKREGVDGVVAYASDPAAPTAAYVTEKLGLPGIPYATAERFCNKGLFRQFLRENGFAVPWTMTLTPPFDINALEREFITMPFIVKPVDSSGSKGVSIVEDIASLESALESALRYSRSGAVLVEQYLSRDHQHVIEAELFVVDGKVESWGIINSIRDFDTNPLLPAGYSYPSDLSSARLALVKREVSRLVECGGIEAGALNMEMIITADEELFFIDVGPRNGGNMLPDFIGAIAGADYAAATVLSAMGESVNSDSISLDTHNGTSWGLAVLHADSNGYFQRVEYSPTAKRALRKEFLYKKPGDYASRFFTSNDAVGLAFFEFESESLCHDVMNSMSSNMKVVLS